MPQDSGPLLFVLYLSDFRNVVRHCKYTFYADDLHIYLHYRPHDIQACILELNADIAEIIAWADGNGLMLNSDKTQAILLGSARYVNGIDYGSLDGIAIGNVNIDFSTSVKYLGITITNMLA